MLRIYIKAVLVSLLPEQYRATSLLQGSEQLWLATIVCGLSQAMMFGFAFMSRFYSQILPAMGQAGVAVLNSEKGPMMNEMQVRLSTGVLGVAGFALQPVNMFLGYMVVEGMMRAFAAFVLGEIFGTLPLYLVSLIHRRLRPTRHQTSASTPDEIQPPRDDTYDVHVLSCLPKREWTPYVAIRFRNELYILVGEESEEGPRPFGYRLRKNPTGQVLMRVREYQLDDPGEIQGRTPNF
jgi:hypothetical protein